MSQKLYRKTEFTILVVLVALRATWLVCGECCHLQLSSELHGAQREMAIVFISSVPAFSFSPM